MKLAKVSYAGFFHGLPHMWGVASFCHFLMVFDTKRQTKAGIPLAPYLVFAPAALISLSLLVFIHYRS
jgi:hypothetical protein